MAIDTLVLSYPDFRLSDLIDPEQFDMNNGDIKDKVDSIISVLNQLTDSITNGASGADAISLSAIAPFASTKLQSYLQEVITRLQSTTDSASGADLLGSTSIPGVVGTTIQAQLESLKGLLDAVKTTSDSNAVRATNLESRATNVESRATTLESRATANETNIATNSTNLVTHKSSNDHDARYYQKSETYSNTQTYSKQEVNTMASLKTSYIVDGGSFLDTYGSQSGVVDGGVF